MGIIKEPKHVDFTVEYKPWTEEELKNFRKLITELREKSIKRKIQASKKKKNADV